MILVLSALVCKFSYYLRDILTSRHPEDRFTVGGFCHQVPLLHHIGFTR
jgi:hypothetical protein